MSTTSICTANYATPCVPCYILASTAVYSPPYNLTTIEVEATPYIYPYQNGSSSTSWKYVTLTQTMPTRLSDGETQPTATSDGIIFSDPTDVTWTTGDLTLTYPTTYINYYAFSGVGVDVTNETACAQFDSISKLAIPSNTDEMSFLMEFTPTGTTTSYAQYGPATSFPQGVLRYLDTFPAVTSQLGGQPVESCLPIKASPECTTSKSSKHCSTKCLTGLPTATMYYTNISTSVRPATTYTITNYNSSTPSYSYTTLPETTFTKTSISTTTLVNTKNNYTTVSCATTCTDRGGPSSSAVPSAPFFTFTLTTASILTTIKKNPIFATVPEGIVDDEPARAPEKPTVTTNAATTIPNAPPRPASPTAIPVGKTTKKNVGDSGVGLITCVGANCGQTAASRPTKGASLGSGDEPQENDNKPPGNTNKPPGNTNKPSENANRPPGNANKPNPIDSDDDEQHSPSRIPTIVAIITAASQTLTITKSNNGALVLGTKTLPSGRTITLPNTQLLRNDDASSAIYLDTSKIHFSTLLTQEGSPQLSGVIFTGVRGNIEIATKIHPGVFVIEGITLIAGQAVTLSHGGGILSVGSNNIIQLDGAVLGITALGAAAIYYNIGKQTLTPGGIITQDTETIISLDDSGRIYYIDGSSIPISDGVVNVGGTKYTPVVMATTITTTTTGEVGGYVMQAIASAASVRLSATATVRESGRETGSETRSEVASASPTSSSSVRGVSGLRGWMVGLVIAGIFAVVY